MKFTKMHGLGNDFILLNGFDIPEKKDYGKLAIKLCNRHTGIGSDGMIIILPSDKADIRMRIINADGSESGMCGNGVRCFSKYVYDKKIIDKVEFEIETLSGIIKPKLKLKNNAIISIEINMGNPEFSRGNIPILGDGDQVLSESIYLDNNEYKITSMLIGVPHTTLFVDSLENIDVCKIGPDIEKHTLFPKKTNVNFVELLNASEIKLRTWERGSGLVMASGTGSCAAVVSGVLNNKNNRKVTVWLEVGSLLIHYMKNGEIIMEGPAEYICDGEIA